MEKNTMQFDERCRICKGLAGEPLCQGFLAESERSRQPRVHRQYAARQKLFIEGDPSIYVFYIHAGTVKLSKMGLGEKPVVLRLLGAGDMLGYRAVITNEEYAATAEALQDCTVCAIPRESFLAALETNQRLALHFVKLLCSELRESEELWLHDSQETAQKRTMRVLERLADGNGEIVTGGNNHTKPLQRSEIAEVIGISSETFSRMLKKLSDRGIVTVDRNVIRLTKPMKMER